MFPVNVIGALPPVDREINVGSVDGSSNTWRAPEEAPVAFVYNRRNYAVMLATPQDIADYVVGFSLTERIIEQSDDILSLDIINSDRGVDLRVQLTQERLEWFELRQRRRNLPGNAGCGVCGLENADEFFIALPKVSDVKASLDPKVIEKAFLHLSAQQPINQRTRSVHAAAWVGFDGAIKQLREDVGRHNALDKLLGALMLAQTDPKTGFVLLTSRCSYELVEKAARYGVTAMASLSGPTNFALRKAVEANMALYTRSPTGVVEILD
ncbi:MAG: sulfurtransferase FdhD [Hyphococcus sp.]|nr:MAG: sulfurtransferase FdhD [Marinicaulis sp.]